MPVVQIAHGSAGGPRLGCIPWAQHSTPTSPDSSIRFVPLIRGSFNVFETGSVCPGLSSRCVPGVLAVSFTVHPLTPWESVLSDSPRSSFPCGWAAVSSLPSWRFRSILSRRAIYNPRQEEWRAVLETLFSPLGPALILRARAWLCLTAIPMFFPMT